MRDRGSFVYIVTNRGGSGRARTLYIGVTSDLSLRIAQHKAKTFRGFTSRFNLTILVYFEEFGDIRDAIAREKELKGWRRARKILLITKANPKWVEIGV